MVGGMAPSVLGAALWKVPRLFLSRRVGAAARPQLKFLHGHARDDVFRVTVDIPKSGAQLHLLPEPRLARQSCPMYCCAMFRDDAICKFSDPVCKFSDPVYKLSDAVCKFSDPVCKLRGRIHASNGPT